MEIIQRHLQWKDTIDTVLKMLLENNAAVTEQLDRIQSSSPQLTALRDPGIPEITT